MLELKSNGRLLCSTGSLIGRSNGYNYHLITETFSAFLNEGLIDGGELMMLKAYYPNINEISAELIDAGLSFPVIHCEKDVGAKISDLAVIRSRGEKAAELYSEVISLFKLNCEMGCRLNSRRMVLHLWGGLSSDSAVEYNIEMLDLLISIAAEYGIKVLVENVPCTTYDPLENWHRLKSHLPKIGFIFDTRFGHFHNDTEDIWNDAELRQHISHVHISDSVGHGGEIPRDFTKLRPILHPGEGKIDFDSFANVLESFGYTGTFTVESPVMLPDGGLDIDKMRETLKWVRNKFNI